MIITNSDNSALRPWITLTLAVVAVLLGGCASRKPTQTIAQRPNVTPDTQPDSGESLHLQASDVKPMYTEMLPIDLPTVAGVAAAENFDIRAAREAVVSSRGALESTIGAALPAIVPTALFEHVEGTVRATEGNLVGVGFKTFQPSIAVQWVINPGRVIYDIVAAKKRLAASEHRERAVILEILRRGASQYYDLVLAQAAVAAAGESVAEAEELLRITELQVQTGTGVPADAMHAEARLAGRRQELMTALNDFYQASITLTLTLHLDASITLVPSIEELPPTQLVRDDLTIEQLLDLAVAFRPDLQSVRSLVEAVEADRDATWWGEFGPRVAVSYQYGGITGHANNVVSGQGIPGNLIVNSASSSGTFSSQPLVNGFIKEGILRGSKRAGGRSDRSFGFSDQQRFRAETGWRLSLASFGELKRAKAAARQAVIEAWRQIDQVRAEVVSAAQESKTHRALIDLAHRQVTAATEAFRLSEANLSAGTMTTLDLLQAQDAIAQARLRYAEAVVRYNKSQVDLLAALGLLEQQSFGIAAQDRTVANN